VQGRAYAIVLTGVLTVLIGYSIRYGYGMLLPEMLPALGITKVQAGTIFTFYFIIYTIFSAILGILSDLYSYRLMLVLFTGLLGAGALMMGFVDNFIQACLAFSLAGLGHAACWAPVTGLVQKWVPDNRRGIALSFVSLGIGIGLIVWGFLLPIIVGHADWRAGWQALGYTAIVIAILNLLLIREPAGVDEHSKADAQSRLTSYWSSFRALFGSKIFWVIGIAYMLIGFNVLVPFTFISVYAREALHLPYAESTRFIPVIALMGIVGQFSLGPLSDRLGRIKMVILCTTLMALGCLGMVFSYSAWSLYVMAGIYGLGYGAVWLLYAAAARDFFPRGTIGSVVGLWTVFYGLGSMASPVICGWIIHITAGYSWAFILGFISGMLSNAALLAMPARGRKNVGLPHS
jgi:MFS family permease